MFCADSRKSNGLAFDANDRLFACCGANEGARALCEVTAEGQIVPVAERFNGHQFNAPNDLVVLPNGTVYFSDPRYVGSEPIEMDSQNVYLLNMNSNILSVATREIEKPMVSKHRRMERRSTLRKQTTEALAFPARSRARSAA